jgi:two-component system, sensor histidine kinase RegB
MLIGRRQGAVVVKAQVAIQEKTNRKNLLLLVYLRWLAVAGQVAAIGLAAFWCHFDLPIFGMGCVIVCLIGLNLFTLRRSRSRLTVSNLELLVELLLDVTALTVQLFFSGGATNPFVSLFLLQAILGAMLLRPWATWTVVAISSGCYLGLMQFYRDIGLAMPMADDRHPILSNLHTTGMFVCFLLAAVLLVLFVTRINSNLREQDLRLAELRQQSAEEGHIVRMGLLASGAAHELGTPLSTISVILNDWQHMPMVQAEPELAVDLTEIQAQLARCKGIVSGILRSSGEARGEGAERGSLIDFLDDVIGDWEQGRDPPKRAYSNLLESDVVIVSDVLLKQVIFNVLDNALEASPTVISVQVARERDTLSITVRDTGPGFPDEILSEVGKPYQSTKGDPGRGLGLFLVVNVLRKLGGRVIVSNPPGGGAAVELHIPIRALSVDPGHGG